MIKAPGWCADAVPTLRGWKHPRTSEILKKRSHTQAQIDEWHAAQGSAPAPTPAPTPAPQPEPVVEEVETDEPMAEEPDLESMSKEELEELGREHGIELDRRRLKSQLISTLRSVIEAK